MIRKNKIHKNQFNMAPDNTDGENCKENLQIRNIHVANFEKYNSLKNHIPYKQVILEEINFGKLQIFVIGGL